MSENTTTALQGEKRETPDYSFQIEAYPGGKVGGFVINGLCLIGLVISTVGLLFLYKG